MRLYEFDTGVEIKSDPHYNANQDSFNKKHLDDTRSPKIFLKDLNRLKKLRALNKLENLKHEKLLGVMYKIAPSE